MKGGDLKMLGDLEMLGNFGKFMKLFGNLKRILHVNFRKFWGLGEVLGIWGSFWNFGKFSHRPPSSWLRSELFSGVGLTPDPLISESTGRKNAHGFFCGLFYYGKWNLRINLNLLKT